MTSTSLIDHHNSHDNFNSLDHNRSDYDDYKQKLFEKMQTNNPNGNSSFLDTLEELRREQRVRLAEAEHNYYNQKSSASLDIPNHTQEEIQRKQETLVTTKPPLPKASRQSPSPVFLTEERAQHHLHHRPMSTNIVRRHDDGIAFCPHRTLTGDNTITVHDLTTDHVKKQIRNMWNEFDLEDYLEQKKNRRAPTSSSWAGRITIPEPFSLTESMNLENSHRTRCINDMLASRLQKAVEEEINLSRSIKANPVPKHVHMPLYEQLQEEQRIRSEQVRNMTRQYLNSISKPFGFDAREKAKTLIRRHSYSGGDIIRPKPQFTAKPLPDFYYHGDHENEQIKEKELYRSLQRDMRAKDLLRQSRLPFSKHKPQLARRSTSAIDLSRTGYQEHAFKPKINGYYVPNYDKNYAKFLRSMEQTKRTRSPTKCKPFLLYTNMIPSKKEKILNDIKSDAQKKHYKTFQIKGKQMPTKSASLVNLSTSLQQSESIPTKTTEAQRLREAVGRKKRRDEEVRNKFQDTFERAKSAKERRVREQINERAKLEDQATILKAKKAENLRSIRQGIRQNEDDYARRLDEMNQRVQQRPLLLEQNRRHEAVRKLEKKIQQAMNIAEITEQDLIPHYNSS